jgi:hypothetical protein
LYLVHNKLTYNWFLADVYASYFEDWVDPLSLLGVIVVLHTEIGEAQRNGRAHSDLLENGIFFVVTPMFLPPQGNCMVTWNP